MRASGAPCVVSELVSWRLAGLLPAAKALDEVLLRCTRLGTCLPHRWDTRNLVKAGSVSENSSHVPIALVRLAAKVRDKFINYKSESPGLLKCQETGKLAI